MEPENSRREIARYILLHRPLKFQAADAANGIAGARGGSAAAINIADFEFYGPATARLTDLYFRYLSGLQNNTALRTGHSLVVTGIADR